MEVAVVTVVIIILAVLAVPVYRYFIHQSDIANAAAQILNVLRIAQNKTLASEGLDQWGVFFDDQTQPHQFTLFKGTSYETRDNSFDEIHKLSNAIEIFEIDFLG